MKFAIDRFYSFVIVLFSISLISSSGIAGGGINKSALGKNKKIEITNLLSSTTVQVLTDPRCDYSFKFPKGWEVSVLYENADNTPDYVAKRGLVLFGPQDEKIELEIFLNHNPKLGLNEWFDTMLKPLLRDDATVLYNVKVSTEKVAAITAYETNPGQSYPMKYVVFTKGLHVFRAKYTNLDTTGVTEKKFDDMLATFEFK